MERVNQRTCSHKLYSHSRRSSQVSYTVRNDRAVLEMLIICELSAHQQLRRPPARFRMLLLLNLAMLPTLADGHPTSCLEHDALFVRPREPETCRHPSPIGKLSSPCWSCLSTAKLSQGPSSREGRPIYVPRVYQSNNAPT